MKPEEVSYANDSIIFQHHLQQQQHLQQQHGVLYTGGADLSDAPLPPLPSSGYNGDSNTADLGYSYHSQRLSRHSIGADSYD